MSNDFDYGGVVALYEKIFGEKPKFTGASMFDGIPPIEKLITAIESGKPFNDIPMPDGALV